MNEEQRKKIKSGVRKYLAIMKGYWGTNVIVDTEFQKKFNGFYRIRQRDSNWYHHYYQILEELKTKNKKFDELLQEFKNRCNRIEASFISKMYATKNPEYPIIDTWVLKNLRLKLPYIYDKNRISKIINLYEKIIEWYSNLLSMDEGKNYIQQFDAIWPNCPITDVKKIDFILWQMR